MNERIFGYKAHLVLEDDEGNEFEVRDFLTNCESKHGGLNINFARVIYAIHAYEASKPSNRPIF